MQDKQTRIFTGLFVLVLVWIGVYWMWEPGRPDRPRISVAPIEPVDDEPSPEDEAPADPSGVVAPEFETHTVRTGETFQDIAERYYDRRVLWTVIARANPRIDPRSLREGMTVRVPVDPGNVQGRRVGTRADGEPEAPQRDGEPGEGEPGPDASDLSIEYIVQPNDSLTLIAQKHYGSTRYADLIFEANRDRLESRDAIRVGQVLILPPLGDE